MNKQVLNTIFDSEQFIEVLTVIIGIRLQPIVLDTLCDVFRHTVSLSLPILRQAMDVAMACTIQLLILMLNTRRYFFLGSRFISRFRSCGER